MTKSDQIKILNDKIKANNAQYNINRLNAEISAFSEGDLDKYEFLTRKDLKYKPNALDKAKFEFSPLGKAFNQGLDKKAENCKEEGVIKLLKDIRDKMFRPIGNTNNNRNNGGNNDDHRDNDDNGDDRDNGDNGNNDDNGDDRNDRDNRDDRDNGDDDDDDDDDDYGDEYLLKLDRLLKNLKDDKSKKELEAEELEAEELDRKFKKLINKKPLESFKEYLKKGKYIDPRNRVNALRKKLNNLLETSSDERSDERSDDNEDKGDDSEDNQISNFVDRVLKKVSKDFKIV